MWFTPTLGFMALQSQLEPSISGQTMAKLFSRDVQRETTKCSATTTCAVTEEAGSSGLRACGWRKNKVSHQSNVRRGITSRKVVANKELQSLTWESTVRWMSLVIISCKRMVKRRSRKAWMELLTMRRKSKHKFHWLWRDRTCVMSCLKFIVNVLSWKIFQNFGASS